jgi:hypothetical protein
MSDIKNALETTKQLLQVAKGHVDTNSPQPAQSAALTAIAYSLYAIAEHLGSVDETLKATNETLKATNKERD